MAITLGGQTFAAPIVAVFRSFPPVSEQPLWQAAALGTGTVNGEAAMLGEAAAAKMRELSRSQRIRCATTVNELPVSQRRDQARATCEWRACKASAVAGQEKVGQC
jgi:hypothetical protein